MVEEEEEETVPETEKESEQDGPDKESRRGRIKRESRRGRQSPERCGLGGRGATRRAWPDGRTRPKR